MRASTRSLTNLTTHINKVASAEELRKWGGDRSRGIPQKPRDQATKITTIYENSRMWIAGRNKCNGFNSNQYCIISKENFHAVLVDLCDDWADDWEIFLREAKAYLRCIFFTHLHVDNLLGIAPFLHMRPGTAIAWNYTEKYWADKYKISCLRYGRPEIADAWLPFYQAPLTGNTPGYNHILLSSDHNRLSPTLELSPNIALFHIYSPGHTMGHTMLHLPVERLLFSGDLIGFDWIGRVDLPQGSGRLMAQSLRSLEDFPDQTVLLPGHGALTTLGRERKHNLGLKRVYDLLRLGATDPCVGLNKGFL